MSGYLNLPLSDNDWTRRTIKPKHRHSLPRIRIVNVEAIDNEYNSTNIDNYDNAEDYVDGGYCDNNSDADDDYYPGGGSYENDDDYYADLDDNRLDFGHNYLVYVHNNILILYLFNFKLFLCDTSILEMKASELFLHWPHFDASLTDIYPQFLYSKLPLKKCPQQTFPIS